MHETTFLLRRFIHGGGSALPAIRGLIDAGERDHAAVVTRLALSRDDGSERQQLLAVLEELTNAPSGWQQALETFATAPSDDAWQELMQFVPEDELYQRLKYTVLVLIGMGCDGNTLFRCVSRMGMIPELVVSGHVASRSR